MQETKPDELPKFIETLKNEFRRSKKQFQNIKTHLFISIYTKYFLKKYSYFFLQNYIWIFLIFFHFKIQNLIQNS